MPKTGLLDEVARDSLELAAGHSQERGHHSPTPWVRIAAPRVNLCRPVRSCRHLSGANNQQQERECIMPPYLYCVHFHEPVCILFVSVSERSVE